MPQVVLKPTSPPDLRPSSSSVTLISHGASIAALHVGGRNIVQTFPSAAHFEIHNAPYFGETIGRVSNRVAGAKVEGLNGGKSYPLAVNDNGCNCLHGGKKGWGKKQWDGPVEVQRGDREAVLFKYVSEDGDEGFPGRVEVRVWYSVSNVDEVDGQKEGIVLDVEYEVEMIGDQPEGVDETVVAVTNHSYFNLSPNHPTIAGHTATFPSTLHLPVDPKTQIPTGDISPYPFPSSSITSSHNASETSVSFTAEGPSPDHCFIVNSAPENVPLDTRSNALKTLVSLHHPESKIRLQVSSTEPAFQFYTGDGISVPKLDRDESDSERIVKEDDGSTQGLEHGLDGKERGARAGFAIEPSRYVDCASRPKWRGMCLLRTGEVYGSRSRYKAWVE